MNKTFDGKQPNSRGGQLQINSRNGGLSSTQGGKKQNTTQAANQRNMIINLNHKKTGVTPNKYQMLKQSLNSGATSGAGGV
jgi:hypothetical protein